MHEAKLFIDGVWIDGADQQIVNDKYDGSPITLVHNADRTQVSTATERVAARQSRLTFTPYERYEVLARASSLLAQRRDEFVRVIIADAGFTVQDAQREVDRATQTLLICGEEAKRIAGEVVPMHGAPGWTGRLGFTVRHPVGVVAAITPFNSPLNTVAHKVGPAIAAGNGVILKPASPTPLTAVHFVQLLLDAGLDPGLIALLHGSGSTVGQWLLEDAVPAYYAFTGSTAVGLQLRQSIGLRRAQLELGSISSTIICADAALEHAAELCVNAAFRKAGQVCTSIQRLYVDRGVLAEFAAKIAGHLTERRVGDPKDERTFVGPVISPQEADRVSDWVTEATDRGAQVAFGGGRDNQVIQPTVLTGVTSDMSVMKEEIFGPVVVLRPFEDFGAALDEVNATPFGLAAGIFTADIDRALLAAANLRVGSVHINETSSSRIDLMPYGGVKLSGSGHEGPRYAIAEMTEQRLITIGASNPTAGG